MGGEQVLGIVFPLSSVIVIPSFPVEDSFLALSRHFCSKYDLPPPCHERERGKPLTCYTNLCHTLSILVLYQQICTTLASGLGYT